MILKTLEHQYRIVDKSWGFEKWIAEEKEYFGKELVCMFGRWSSNGRFHWHEKKRETFYIIEGVLYLEIMDNGVLKPFHLTLGESITLPPMVGHRFRAASQPVCRFFEFSTHHSDEDTYYAENKKEEGKENEGKRVGNNVGEGSSD